MSGLAAAPYLSYLLVGGLYFLVFGAMAGVAVRASLVGLGAVFVPLLLGGYGSSVWISTSNKIVTLRACALLTNHR